MSRKTGKVVKMAKKKAKIRVQRTCPVCKGVGLHKPAWDIYRENKTLQQLHDYKFKPPVRCSLCEGTGQI